MRLCAGRDRRLRGQISVVGGAGGSQYRGRRVSHSYQGALDRLCDVLPTVRAADDRAARGVSILDRGSRSISVAAWTRWRCWGARRLEPIRSTAHLYHPLQAPRSSEDPGLGRKGPCPCYKRIEGQFIWLSRR